MIKDVPRVAVLMCVWRRLHLLPKTLQQLIDQQWVDIDLYLWNNNFTHMVELESIVARYRPYLKIDIWHSTTNVGCFGRFIYAHQLKQRYPFFVVIDDDQYFDDWFIRTLWDQRQVGGVTACHAFRFIQNRCYWERLRPEPFDAVNYCGPGGMIFDSQILRHASFFACPEKFRIMDDIWLSYVFNHLMRVPMKKSSASVKMIDSANDTFHSLRSKKSEFLTELRRQGWRV